MKGKKLTRLAAVLLVAVLSVAALPVTTFADGPTCTTCSGALNPIPGEYWNVGEQCAQVYGCSNGHKQLIYDTSGNVLGASAHVASKNATCTEAAVCGNCGKTIAAALGHSFDEGKVTKPTCNNEGYTTYTCKVCGYKKVTDKVKRLSHWYDLWEPTGSGQNSAPCKRDGCTYTKTTACVDWDFKLIPAGADQAEKYTICPVCGALSDGGRLELVEDAFPTPITGWTPEGDMVLRCGALDNGERVICVGFEFDARLAQCTGLTKFTIPAELAEGCKLMLLDEKGNETELEVETDDGSVTFTLNFYGDSQGKRTPVQMIHLVPVGE